MAPQTEFITLVLAYRLKRITLFSDQGGIFIRDVCSFIPNVHITINVKTFEFRKKLRYRNTAQFSKFRYLYNVDSTINLFHHRIYALEMKGNKKE